jgi:hypothetical protein
MRKFFADALDGIARFIARIAQVFTDCSDCVEPGRKKRNPRTRTERRRG